jgi:hypothetical protein
VPERLAILANREKIAISMPADSSVFHSWLEQQA